MLRATKDLPSRLLQLLFRQSLETVLKVSETLPAEPKGSPRSGFSVHFALRIAAKSSLGLLLVPFSDSLSRQLGEQRPPAPCANFVRSPT